MNKFYVYLIMICFFMGVTYFALIMSQDNFGLQENVPVVSNVHECTSLVGDEKLACFDNFIEHNTNYFDKIDQCATAACEDTIYAEMASMYTDLYCLRISDMIRRRNCQQVIR